MKLPELNSECFQRENHESSFEDALGLSYIGREFVPSKREPELYGTLRRYAVGWCDAQRLQYKPMYGYVAIMCERDGYRFWFHIMQDTFNKVFE